MPAGHETGDTDPPATKLPWVYASMVSEISDELKLRALVHTLLKAAITEYGVYL